MSDREQVSESVLRSLGTDALVEWLQTTAYGVCVTGEDHTWVYLNPAAERIIGHRLEDVRGQDYLLHFPEHERDVLLALEGEQRQGDTDFYTNTVLHPDGVERRITWSGSVVEVDGVELAPAIFHETTASREARQRAARVRDLVGGTDQPGRLQVLSGLLEDSARATRAVAAVLLMEDAHGQLEVVAAAGSAPDAAAELRGSARLSDLPAVTELSRGADVFVPDAADVMGADPRTSPWVGLLSPEPWSGAGLYAVRCDGALAGCLMVLLPASLTSPSESERETWSSVADQVGIAVGADRMRRDVSQTSALHERTRIARDLHDSVSQALFSVHARAQVVRRALDAGDEALAREAAEHLEQLSRQATTELRQLVTELRDEHDAGFDLVTELQRLAEDTAGLHGVPVEVSAETAGSGPDARIAEHVARVAGEALHNAVKHADASRCALQLRTTQDELHLTVTDDGRGFDPSATSGGHGQRTMRERARLCGGDLDVVSRTGAGTTVTLTVPLSG